MTLRLAAGAAGLLVILAPLARLLLSSRRARGLSVGSGKGMRSWPAVSLMTVSFIALGWLLWHPLPLVFPPGADALAAAVGGLLYFPAIGLYLWGFAELGPDFRVSTSSGADLYADHRLVTSGPFRFVRHPMYLAVLLAAIGALLIFRTWAMLVFLPMSFVITRRAKHEEELLAKEFGTAWLAYAARVPKWLPFSSNPDST